MEKVEDGKEDPPPHPKKLKHLTTGAILLGNFCFGCGFNFFGPALEDLKDKFGVSIDEISLVFTITTISYCVGALSSGVIFNYMNRQLAVSISLGCMAVVIFVTPHVPSKTAFFVLGSIFGLFAGPYDTAQMVWMMELWQGEAGPYIQAQSLFYALGTIVPPLLIAPFLSDDNSDCKSDEETSIISNTTTLLPPSSTVGEPFESNMLIPFTIGGILMTIACSYQIFLLIFFRYYKPAFVVDLYSPQGDLDKKPSLDKGNESHNSQHLEESKERIEDQRRIKSRIIHLFKDIHWYKLELIVLTGLFLAFYVGMEWCTMQFVPVFGKYSDLQMCDSDSARVLTGVTAAFAAGRFIGIFIILKVNPQYLLVSNLLISVCGNVIILIWGGGNLIMLWVGCATLGTGMSILYPSFCAYMEQHLMFTDPIGSFIIVTSAGVSSLYPVIVGGAIEENPVILTYTNLFSITVCTIALILAFKLTYGNHRRV